MNNPLDTSIGIEARRQAAQMLFKAGKIDASEYSRVLIESKDDERLARQQMKILVHRKAGDGGLCFDFLAGRPIPLSAFGIWPPLPPQRGEGKRDGTRQRGEGGRDGVA